MIPDEVRYAKGHGTENDFVILFDPERTLDLTPSLVQALCDRRRGLGADGVLRVVLAATDPEGAPMSDAARWFMDYRNADGSIAEMCGNGIRVFARYLVDSYLESTGELAIASRGGVKRVRLGAIGDVSVEMGGYELPDVGPLEISVGAAVWPATPVYVPNPHAVVFLDDLTHAGTLESPPQIRPASAFSDGANVEFAVIRGHRHVAMRVHERGVGETRSCGTGACAVAIAAARLQSGGQAGTDRPSEWTVDVAGGRLTVALYGIRSVTLSGPAVLVAEGALSHTWLAANR